MFGLPCQRRNVRPLLSDDVLHRARDWQFLFDAKTRLLSQLAQEGPPGV